MKSSPEERIVLYDVSWEAYDRLLADHLDRSVPHFAYYRGTLEIARPSLERERINRSIAMLVALLADEKEVDAYGLGSTIFRREDLKCGIEPDSCFYLRNARRIRGKKELDLTVDPPPDLIMEVDPTGSPPNKFPIYTLLSVPEVWRYDGDRATIFVLGGGEYVQARESAALPSLTSTVLTRFIEESASLGSTDWLRRVRDWAHK